MIRDVHVLCPFCAATVTARLVNGLAQIKGHLTYDGRVEPVRCKGSVCSVPFEKAGKA